MTNIDPSWTFLRHLHRLALHTKNNHWYIIYNWSPEGQRLKKNGQIGQEFLFLYWRWKRTVQRNHCKPNAARTFMSMLTVSPVCCGSDIIIIMNSCSIFQNPSLVNACFLFTLFMVFWWIHRVKGHIDDSCILSFLSTVSSFLARRFSLRLVGGLLKAVGCFHLTKLTRGWPTGHLWLFNYTTMASC